MYEQVSHSLLNRILASDHGLRIGVLVNDFGSVNIDAELVASFIEMTRVPVPSDDPAYKETGSFAGLLRAADFIGQRLRLIFGPSCDNNLQVIVPGKPPCDEAAKIPIPADD